LKQAIDSVNWLNLVAFTALAALAIGRWRARRDRAAAWAAASFATLGIVVLLGRLVPEHPHLLVQRVVQRLDLVVLLFFPYLLYRFTTAFDPPSRRLTRIVGSMTAVLVAWTLALPWIPAAGETRPRWFVAWLVAFLVHWTVLAVVVAVRLWRAGRGQPGVARRRMQMLSFAAGAITVALVLIAATTRTDSPLALATGLLAFVSAIAFTLGLAPPQIVRTAWRGREQRRLQEAIESIMQLATGPEEIAARVLRPMADIVGARAVAIQNDDGRLVGTYNVPEPALEELARGGRPRLVHGDTEMVELDVPGGALLVWTTPYAPFFGGEELRLLRTLGALTGLALDRSRLFANEHEARLALERADEVKSNFIALAAHELRTPVASVSGAAQTLASLRDRIAPAQRIQLEDALAQQTTKLALLVEQLLDLSRLDAEAIEIEPRRFPVRARVEELLTTVGGLRTNEIDLAIEPELVATADPAAFDRIVSNLITNALRYGEPPIVVHAERTDNHFRIAIEDRGPGVAPEFVPDLFERFTRSDASRERAIGTGLGLAIARAYAHAHRGDLVYEPAEPRGARFQLVLPA
jgi:signal transduction histidine kinase